MSLLNAALLGLLQGVTEFLPVSSTAHLLIGARLIGFNDPGGVFTVMIQLGSICAVMWLYRAKIVHVVASLATEAHARHFAAGVVAAVVPLVVAGALLAKFVKTVLYESFSVIGIAFIAGGVVMLVVERFRPQPVVVDAERMSIGRAFAVGLGQTLALIPGVSRSGGTIVAAMLLRVDRPAAAEFSFFLAMPTTIVNAKPWRTSPPKKNRASAVRSAVPDVMIVRLSVWFTDALITSRSESRRIDRRFSRTRSKITIVSLVE